MDIAIDRNKLVNLIVSQCWFMNCAGEAYIDYKSEKVYSISQEDAEPTISVSTFDEILDAFYSNEYSNYTMGVVK